jgi:type II secretory pathway pseudopilin PulG
MVAADKKRNGFSLGEVIVALGLMSFVALVVVGVFLTLMQSSTKNREQIAAELLTESLLEKATAAGPPAWGVEGKLGQPLSAGDSALSNDTYYQVDSTLVAEERGEMWEVSVTVAWWSENANMDGSRVGHGNTHVTGTRSVYYGRPVQ